MAKPVILGEDCAIRWKVGESAFLGESLKVVVHLFRDGRFELFDGDAQAPNDKLIGEGLRGGSAILLYLLSGECLYDSPGISSVTRSDSG